ncbi:MAG TPA: 4-hydroxy-tetrahydrodipicolinate reductase [Candidatus Eremiobacteraceae bacterium]|nr:4-hydroxy-tetrahydrodipicolinate reductase [Candidatus Eremiobacteraceae bacterium]
MAPDSVLRVAVAGARGRTGSVIIDALRRSPGIALVGMLVRSTDARASHEFSDLDRLVKETKPDVLVDFTVFPDSKTIALKAISLGIRPVIGTSGYKAADIEELREASQHAKIGAIYAANFSIGAMLMMQFAQAAAPYFSHAEIIETHHTGKKDSPSGTALATAQRIAEAGRMQRAPSEIVKAQGARGAEVGGVGIHSIRTPGVVGVHEVRLSNDDEQLTITHSTSTRSAFVAGVLRAVRAAPALDHLVEGLERLAL